MKEPGGANWTAISLHFAGAFLALLIISFPSFIGSNICSGWESAFHIAFFISISSAALYTFFQDKAWLGDSVSFASFPLPPAARHSFFSKMLLLLISLTGLIAMFFFLE